MDYTKFDTKTVSEVGSEATYSSGLRTYMVSVYKQMSIALFISGFISLLVASSPQMMQLVFGTPLIWVAMLAPIGIVIYMGAKIATLSADTARGLLYVYAATMGVSLASVFAMYTGESIARTFFITASTFGAMSIYGYSTKRDLSGFGSFLFMGIIGIMIAGLVNMFMQSSAIAFAISVLGLLIAIGFTAYDTQRIKEMYFEVSNSPSDAEKVAVYGALALYTDFVNLFIYLLRLFGDRRSE